MLLRVIDKILTKVSARVKRYGEWRSKRGRVTNGYLEVGEKGGE